MPEIPLHDRKLELVQVAALIARAEDTIAAEGIRRDDLIRGLSEAGVSRREVAQLARVTPGQVQQILAGSLFNV
jgi:hypothetical protein